MLVGRYPFQDVEPAALFSKIRRGAFTIPETLSPRAKSLVCCMLRKSPVERLEAADILLHPWLHCSTNTIVSQHPNSRHSTDQVVPDFGEMWLKENVTKAYIAPEWTFICLYYRDCLQWSDTGEGWVDSRLQDKMIWITVHTLSFWPWWSVQIDLRTLVWLVHFNIWEIPIVVHAGPLAHYFFQHSVQQCWDEIHVYMSYSVDTSC